MLAEFLELLDRNLREIDLAKITGLKDAVGAMIAACLSPSTDRMAAAKDPLDVGRLRENSAHRATELAHSWV